MTQREPTSMNDREQDQPIATARHPRSFPRGRPPSAQLHAFGPNRRGFKQNRRVGETDTRQSQPICFFDTMGMGDKLEKWTIDLEAIDEILATTRFDSLTHRELTNEHTLYKALKDKPGFHFKRTLIAEARSSAKEESHRGKGQPHKTHLSPNDLGQSDFNLFFLKDIAAAQSIILISDDSLFLKKKGFKFQIAEFDEFASFFEDNLSMEFFEFSFYVVLYPVDNMIRFLDEQGGVNEFIWVG
jgi:hypothetical protein